MTDWTSTTLSQVVKLQRGHDLPATRRGRGSVPIIGSFGVTGFHDEAMYRGPGVAIGRSGASIGVATYCSEDYWPLNTCLFVKDFQGNDPLWTYYLLHSIDFSAYNSGSVQPMLNRNYIANMPIEVPPVGEQRAIAATLGALDDKVESNRRTRRLVRALGKAKLSAAVAHSAVDLQLSDVVTSISRGITPKYVDDIEAPFILNQRCVRDGSVTTTAARRTVHKAVAAEKRAAAGDVLVNSTGTGTLGRVGRWHEGEVFVDSHVSVVKPDGLRVGPTVLAYTLFEREHDIEGMATGSTGQTELSPRRLGELPVRLPSARGMRGIEDTLYSFECENNLLFNQEQRLTSLRDALLPELLSGRIRVPEATEAIA